VTIDSTFTIASSTISSSGPGSAQITGVSLSEFQINLSTEGIYFLTATATDGQGVVYTDTIAITALNLTDLDTLLQGKWNGMKAALSNSDISGALRFIASGSVDMYSQNFTIMNSILPQIGSDLTTIQFVRTVDNGAVYEMNLSQGGQFTSFYVLLVMDVDGIWKIRFF